MEKTQLEHIIRAVAAITNQSEVIVVGNQSILGTVEYPPDVCKASMEVNVFIGGQPKMSDLIDSALGENSLFHKNFGYYVQGVDENTLELPFGWQSRLTKIQSPNTDLKIGYCIDVVDLFLAKCLANREKDKSFTTALIKSKIVDPEEARQRVHLLPIDNHHMNLVKATISYHVSLVKIANKKSSSLSL